MTGLSVTIFLLCFGDNVFITTFCSVVLRPNLYVNHHIQIIFSVSLARLTYLLINIVTCRRETRIKNKFYNRKSSENSLIIWLEVRKLHCPYFPIYVSLGYINTVDLRQARQSILGPIQFSRKYVPENSLYSLQRRTSKYF